MMTLSPAQIDVTMRALSGYMDGLVRAGGTSLFRWIGDIDPEAGKSELDGFDVPADELTDPRRMPGEWLDARAVYIALQGHSWSEAEAAFELATWRGLIDAEAWSIARRKLNADEYLTPAQHRLACQDRHIV